MNFTGGVGIIGDEKACMANCFAKYNMALDAFTDERKFFVETLDDLKAQGKDAYAARHI